MSRSNTNFFKQARKRVGLSQAEVADCLEFETPQMISNIERGLSVYPIDKIVIVAKTFKVSELAIKQAIFDFKVNKLRKKLGL